MKVTASTRLCPACVQPMRRVCVCHRCGYEAEDGAPNVYELAHGTRDGGAWGDVDLGAYVRAVAPAVARLLASES